MRLVTYEADGQGARPGVLVGGQSGEQVVDVVDACAAFGVPAGLGAEAPRDMIALLATGPEGLDALRGLVAQVQEGGADAAGCVHALERVRLRAPVQRPPRLRGYLTTPGHAQGAGFTLPPAFYQMPVGYDGNPNSMIGPEDELLWPGYTDELDYELEIALVIGKAGRDLTVAQAADHIAGITLFNDVSARDIQGLEMSVMLGPKKSKDFCNVIGPTIATLDGLDEYALEVEGRVNGEVWTRTTSKMRQYSFAEVVAWASWGEDLQPGEVLGLGTVEGGCGVEIDRWIQPGDVVEFELTRVGVLRNRVGSRQVVPGAGIPSFKGAPRAPREGDGSEASRMFAVPAQPPAHVEA